MYLNLVQLAESFGVSEKTIEDWIRDEGLPRLSDRGRLLFDRAQVTQWAAERGLASKAGFLAPAPNALSAGSALTTLLRTGGIRRGVSASSLQQEMSKVVDALPGATPPIRRLVQSRLCAPGGVTWAPVGGGLALPHPSVRVALGRDSGAIALFLCYEGVPEADPPDGVPVTRLFFFVAPSPRAHLDILGKLSRALARGALRELVMRAAPDAEILAALAEAEAASASTAPTGQRPREDRP